MQSFFLVSDDIVDDGETRRGRPCWHTLVKGADRNAVVAYGLFQPDIGLTAVNDALMLESAIDTIVADEFASDHRFAAITLALAKGSDRQ